MEDARQYVRMMNFVRALIEDGTIKLHELVSTKPQGSSWHALVGGGRRRTRDAEGTLSPRAR
jgi:hypothetical protein